MKTIKFVPVLLLGALVIVGASSCHKKSCKKNEEKVYVANEEDGTVSVLDGKNLDEIRKVDVSDKGQMYMIHNIQVAPNGESVWLTGTPPDEGIDEMVIVLKGKRDKVKEYINVGSDQHLAHVVLSDDSKFAYISAKDPGQIIKIDAKEMKEVKRYDLGENSAPHGLRFMNNKLYVACMASHELVCIDTESEAITRVNVGGIAVQTAVLPLLNRVYVSVYDLSRVVSYDVVTGDTVAIQLPSESQGPIQIYPSPDNSKLYVCDQGIVNGKPSSNKLYIINTNTNTISGSVTVGNGAHGVTTSTDGNRIFITNLKDNTVTVVDANSLSVLKTINVGTSPNGISYLDCD